MVRYYNSILLLPVILIVILKVYGFINTKTAIVYWLSFLFSSIMYALTGKGLFAVITLICSLVFINMFYVVFVNLKNKQFYKNGINCVALYVKDNKAVFFDGTKRIEKYVDQGQIIIPGKIYIISKNN